MRDSKTHRVASLFILVLFLGIALRVWIGLSFYGTHDIGAWEHYSTYWQDGLSPYDNNHNYVYSPLWFWIISFFSFVARHTSFAFSFVIKWPLILADLAMVWLICKSSQEMGETVEQTLQSATLFFLNPVSILISGYHGQFDNLSLFLILAAWYVQRFAQNLTVWKTSFFLSLSVAVKHFNILLMPIFFWSEKGIFKKILIFVAAPLLFIFSFLPYLAGSSGEWVIKNVFQYNLGAGYWGWSGIICRSVLFLTGNDLGKASWFPILSYFNPFLYIAMFVATYWILKKYDLLDAIILTFLIFYVFTTQIAPQYTLWIIPFAALRRDRMLNWYTVIGVAQILVFFYCHDHWRHKEPFVGTLANLMPPLFIVLRHLTWVVCVAWFIVFLRRKPSAP